MADDFFVRPMTVADVAEAERLTDDAFADLDRRLRRVGEPDPGRRGPERSAAWRDRAAHLQRTDPGGCWVAEDTSGLLGVAIGMRRDLTWLLASYAVRPGVQGRGIGRPLLEAAQTHGAGCLRAMLSASDDPLALRRYRFAGFTLHPTMVLRGRVSRSLLPVVEHVREGFSADTALMDSVDRQVRDAGHGPDHEVLLRTHRLVVTDRSTGSGYAYLAAGGGPRLVAATNRRTATGLLWETLAASTPEGEVEVGHVTVANEWAVDVGMAARLPLSSRGFLGLRGMRPPAAYLPSGSFL